MLIMEVMDRIPRGKESPVMCHLRESPVHLGNQLTQLKAVGCTRVFYTDRSGGERTTLDL